MDVVWGEMVLSFSGQYFGAISAYIKSDRLVRKMNRYYFFCCSTNHRTVRQRDIRQTREKDIWEYIDRESGIERDQLKGLNTQSDRHAFRQAGMQTKACRL